MPHMANRYLRTAKMKIRAGTTRMKPPANFRCRGDVSRLVKRKAVKVRFSMVKTAAAKTSFHEMTKAKIADAVMPGRISGKTTLVKVPDTQGKARPLVNPKHRIYTPAHRAELPSDCLICISNPASSVFSPACAVTALARVCG